MKWKDIFKLSEVSTAANEHDSIRKHFQIVQKVKEYLEKKVPHEIILDLIMEAEWEA